MAFRVSLPKVTFTTPEKCGCCGISIYDIKSEDPRGGYFLCMGFTHKDGFKAIYKCPSCKETWEISGHSKIDN